MRRFLYLFILACCCLPLAVQAQHELPVDTLHRNLRHSQPEVKQFGEYQLDMRQINVLPSTSKAIGFSRNGIATKNFGQMFKLDAGNVFATGFTNNYSRNILFPGSYGWGYPYYNAGYGYAFDFLPSYYSWNNAFSSNQDMLQGASFKMKNGMRVNVYGKYGADGRLLPGMNALPWQKHDFKGAFEIKSANGAFGLKVEVSREANGGF